METTEFNKYEKVLDMFRSQGDCRATWMHNPFIVNDKAMSTDGHFLAVADRALTPAYEFLDQKNKATVLNALPAERNQNFVISVDDLLSIVKMAPMVPDIEVDNTECDACSGTGEVELDFFHNGKTYDVEVDCPVCDGYGSIEKKVESSVKMVLDPGKKIAIGLCVFNARFIAKLIEVANIFEVSDVQLVYQVGANSPSIFKIGEVEIFLMPMAGINPDSEDILAKIEVPSHSLFN
jgi:hypothetical protein